MKIEAMSFTRKDAVERIMDVAPQIADHILKIFLFPESRYVEGWAKELNTWYGYCRKTGLNLKGGKKLDHDGFFDSLFGPVKNKTEVLKRYKAVIANNPKLKVTSRYPESEIPVLNTAIGAVYITMANSLRDGDSWDDFVQDLRVATHTDKI